MHYIKLDINQNQRESRYIRLAATAADKLNIGIELIMKRSSCTIDYLNFRYIRKNI